MSGKLLLIIEERSDLTPSLSAYLAEEGYEVLTASSLNEVLTLVRQRRPLLCIRMTSAQIKTGYDDPICGELRQMIRFSHIPFLFVTPFNHPFWGKLFDAAGGPPDDWV